MTMRFRLWTGCLTLSAFVVATAHAGPLEPPPGPVEPTMKTLEEVEPRIPVNLETAAPTEGSPADDFTYEISTPGSYYLTGDMTPAKGKQTIVITAPNVTLDLNGFTVFGQTVEADISNSAAISILQEHAIVRNGHVRDSYASGLAAFAGGGTIEDIVAINNGLEGINAPNSTLVRNCFAAQNGFGFYVTDGLVQNCIAIGNDIAGFTVENGEIQSCLAQGNLTGIYSDDSIVRDCKVSGSDLGINAINSKVLSCYVEAGNEGIRLMNSLARNCRILEAGYGIRMALAGSSAIENELNSCADAAILLEGTGHHVEGNTIHDAHTFGIQSDDSGGNFIVKNVIRSTTVGFNLQGANTVGPILGPGAITSDSPWANFVIPSP